MMAVLRAMKCKVSSAPQNPTEERGTPLTVIQVASQVDPNRLVQVSLGTNRHHRLASTS